MEETPHHDEFVDIHNAMVEQGHSFAHRNDEEGHVEKIDSFIASQSKTFSPVESAYLAACRSQVGTAHEICHAYGAFRKASVDNAQIRAIATLPQAPKVTRKQPKVKSKGFKPTSLGATP